MKNVVEETFEKAEKRGPLDPESERKVNEIMSLLGF